VGTEIHSQYEVHAVHKNEEEGMPNIRNRSFAVIAASVTLLAWSGTNDSVKLTPESRLWVDGTSTVRSFSCKAGVIDAVIESAENAVTAALNGEPAIRTVTFSVPTAQMDCGNGTMNGHMMKAIKAKENPKITFKLDSYTLGKGTTSTAATLKGSLTLGGVTRPIVLEAALTAGASGALRVVGAYDLNMKDYDLTPPTLMLGTLKVRENVKVSFDLALR
jgi:polyisoprenoid-binding protein YceI